MDLVIHKKKLTIIFILFILLTNLNGKKTITKGWLENKPRSYAKDFYIWRYLNQNITPAQAIWAIGEVRYVNNKLLQRYSKKLKDKDTSKIISCMRYSGKKLISQNADCIEVGLSSFKATKLNKQQLQIAIDKVKDSYPLSAKRFEIINSILPFSLLIKSTNEVFFATFNQTGGKFRVNNFNHHLPIKLIQQLQKDTKNFAQTIKLIVTNKKLNKIQQSLFNIETKTLSHHSLFFLSMNAIQHNKKQIALKYLSLAYKKAYFKFDKDKVQFWQYRLSKNKKYLKELANSWDINIYSLQAKEQLNITPTNIKYNSAKSINSTKIDYNIHDPFSWLKVLKDVKKVTKSKMDKYENIFNNTQTQGHLAFIKERYERYRTAYYALPYQDLIKNYTTHRQSLINAIARQESRFIPTSISTSYALGVMQIMPFLSKALAKELKEPYDIDKQLEAPTNIRYSHKHLNYLERKLDNVLFVAYAYNGGIGFTTRMLKTGLFQKGKHEPYLSMELVHYDESKKYGKKVLLNYLIYHNYLNKENKLRISTLLQKIKSPYLKETTR